MFANTPCGCGPGLCLFGRNVVGDCDSKPLGDSVFEYCLEKACCASLEEAAAAFAGLGALLTPSENVSPACLQLGTCMVVCKHQQ